MLRTSKVVPVASRKAPAPTVIPIAATTHKVAAVVRPVTLPLACMIVPAPRNPIPGTIWAAMRDGSDGWPLDETSVPKTMESSVSRAAPTQISMLVRRPGARIKGCVKERRRTFPLTINQRVPGCHPGERNVAS